MSAAAYVLPQNHRENIRLVIRDPRCLHHRFLPHAVNARRHASRLHLRQKPRFSRQRLHQRRCFRIPHHHLPPFVPGKAFSWDLRAVFRQDVSVQNLVLLDLFRKRPSAAVLAPHAVSDGAALTAFDPPCLVIFDVFQKHVRPVYPPHTAHAVFLVAEIGRHHRDQLLQICRSVFGADVGIRFVFRAHIHAVNALDLLFGHGILHEDVVHLAHLRNARLGHNGPRVFQRHFQISQPAPAGSLIEPLHQKHIPALGGRDPLRFIVDPFHRKPVQNVPQHVFNELCLLFVFFPHRRYLRLRDVAFHLCLHDLKAQIPHMGRFFLCRLPVRANNYAVAFQSPFPVIHPVPLRPVFRFRLLKPFRPHLQQFFFVPHANLLKLTVSAVNVFKRFFSIVFVDPRQQLSQHVQRL